MVNESFNGFGSATFKFLKQLKTNNNREWFNKNKKRYEDDVLRPSLQFIEAMQPKLKKASPYFTAIAKRTGGSLMRIYRDTRFAKDKTPYKTNIGIQFRHEFGKDIHAPGFYVHIETGKAFFGAGIWRPKSQTLRKIRDHIVDCDVEWTRVAHSKKLLSKFDFEGETLKRAPRDFDAAHPLIEDLKRKDFIIVTEVPEKDLKSTAITQAIGESMNASKPLMQFLCDGLRIPF